MADGVPGPTKAPAARLAEEEDRGGQGPAAVRLLLVGEATVLGHQPNSPTATLSVVVIGYILRNCPTFVNISSGEWRLELLVKLWNLQQRLWGRFKDENKVKEILFAQRYISAFSPGLARVHHLLAGARIVLEVLLRRPVATTSAVVNIPPFKFFKHIAVKQTQNAISCQMFT